MTITRCDICKKDVRIYDTMILYKKSFDYCRKCKAKAENIKQDFQKEIDYENTMLDIHLKDKEKLIIKSM